MVVLQQLLSLKLSLQEITYFDTKLLLSILLPPSEELSSTQLVPKFELAAQKPVVPVPTNS
jgi:hypothetical protein